MKNLKRTAAPYEEPVMDQTSPIDEETVGSPQTSVKRGLKSDAKKTAASRPEYGDSPGAKEVPGAHGDPTNRPVKTSANKINERAPSADPMEKVPVDALETEDRAE